MKAPQPWDEQVSQDFIDYGRYFVPERERQWQIMVDLLPQFDQPGALLDLCCGEGLLVQAILERLPGCTLYGLDGSPEMLRRARERLANFGDSFRAVKFNLLDRTWPQVEFPIQAVVSSLAIHHLEGLEKLALFQEVHNLLAPGGVFLIADIVEPANPMGCDVAAKEWDAAVRERALELDGNMEGFAAFERMRWNTYRYFDPEDIDKPSRLLDQLKWLEQAGFADVDVHWMRAGHAIFGGWVIG